MSEIDHALILYVLGQARPFRGKNEYSWTFIELFSLISEKEEDKYTIWGLVHEL